MTLQEAINNILDPILSPLLGMPSIVAILIISIVITIITTLAYKYLTDQDKMKELKKTVKENQKKLKVLTKENPKKAMELQKKMMEKNTELMKHSFKPTLYTLIPLLLLFGWLNAHMAYEPLDANEAFTVTLEMVKETSGNVTLSVIPDTLKIKGGESATMPVEDDEVTWTLLGDLGDYELTFKHSSGIELEKDVLISGETGRYSAPITPTKTRPFKMVTLSNEKIKPLKGFPIVGNWGWIGIYILFSFAFSFGLRKVLKVA